MVGVGLIVHGGASRDVRRLTSLARTIDLHERANTVARVLAGLLAGGATVIRYMPEPDHIVEHALEQLAAVGRRPDATVDVGPVRLAGGAEAGDEAGTAAAAAMMAAARLDCMVTIGGDGTNRAVLTGWRDAVLVPLPGGTNNAFAIAVDPTAAGLAAARYAADAVAGERFVRRRSLLEITAPGAPPTIAAVDVAVVRGGWVGAHAIWDPDRLLEAIVARSDPTVAGLAGVGGVVHSLDGVPAALHLRFGGAGRTIMAPLGPGQLVPMAIRAWTVVHPGDVVTLPDRSHPRSRGPVTLAFDGERELVLDGGCTATVAVLPDAIRVLDVAALLRHTAAVPVMSGTRRRRTRLQHSRSASRSGRR